MTGNLGFQVQIRPKSAVVHEEKLRPQSSGIHLAQITPRLLRGALHGLGETLPLRIGIRRASAGGSRSGNSGELIVLRLISLAGSQGVSLIHGVHLGEEPVGVISKLLRISQNVLHSACTCSEGFQSFILLNQCVFKSDGVLVQNCRSF